MGAIIAVPASWLGESSPGADGGRTETRIPGPAGSGKGKAFMMEAVAASGLPEGYAAVRLPDRIDPRSRDDDEAAMADWESKAVLAAWEEYRSHAIRGVSSEDIRGSGDGMRDVRLRYDDGSTLRIEIDPSWIVPVTDDLCDIRFPGDDPVRAVLRMPDGEQKRGICYPDDLVRSAGAMLGGPVPGNPWGLLRDPAEAAERTVTLKGVPADAVVTQDEGARVDLPSTSLYRGGDGSRHAGYEEIRIFPDRCRTMPSIGADGKPADGLVDIRIPADAVVRASAVVRGSKDGSSMPLAGWRYLDRLPDDGSRVPGFIRAEDLADAWKDRYGAMALAEGAFREKACMHCARGMSMCLSEVPASDVSYAADPETGKPSARIRMAEPGADGRTWYVYADPDRIDQSVGKDGEAVPDRVDAFLGETVRWESEGPEGSASGKIPGKAAARAYNMASRERSYDRFDAWWDADAEEFVPVPAGRRPDRCVLPVMHGVPDDLIVPVGDGRSGRVSVRLPWKDADGRMAEVDVPKGDACIAVGPAYGAGGKPAEGFRDVVVMPGSRLSASLVRDGDGAHGAMPAALSGLEALDRWEMSRRRYGYGKDLYAAAEAPAPADGPPAGKDAPPSAGDGRSGPAADAAQGGSRKQAGACVRNALIRTYDGKGGKGHTVAFVGLEMDGKKEWGRFFVDDPGRRIDNVRRGRDGKVIADVRLDRAVTVRFGYGDQERRVRMEPGAVASAHQAAFGTAYARNVRVAQAKDVQGKAASGAAAAWEGAAKDGRDATD